MTSRNGAQRTRSFSDAGTATLTEPSTVPLTVTTPQKRREQPVTTPTNLTPTIRTPIIRKPMREPSPVKETKEERNARILKELQWRKELRKKHPYPENIQDPSIVKFYLYIWDELRDLVETLPIGSIIRMMPETQGEYFNIVIEQNGKKSVKRIEPAEVRDYLQMTTREQNNYRMKLGSTNNIKWINTNRTSRSRNRNHSSNTTNRNPNRSRSPNKNTTRRN